MYACVNNSKKTNFINDFFENNVLFPKTSSLPVKEPSDFNCSEIPLR
jgi:hypothetical protein